jgi:ArsR family transcriptional regulator, virulence genes transcriptional regulator
MPSGARPPVAQAGTPDLSRIDEMQSHAGEAARVLKALGNEQRLLILCNLLGPPLSVGELNARLELSQSALSQHLALLRESGLVVTRREAQSIFYSLPAGPVTRIMALLQDIYCDVPAVPKGSAPGSRTPCQR